MKKILIIEDEEDLAEMMRIRIEKNGYKVVLAKNSNAGVDDYILKPLDPKDLLAKIATLIG